MINLSKKQLSKGTILITALISTHFLNFLFNVFLGRTLSFEEFGLITIVNTFWYISAIFFGALALTVNRRVAYLRSKINPGAGANFMKHTSHNSLLITGIISALWIIASPTIGQIFKIGNIWVILLFAPAILLGTLLSINKGYLQGGFSFFALSSIIFFEGASKLILAVAITFINLKEWVFISIPLSIVLSFLFSFYLISSKLPESLGAFSYRFPKKFFSITLLAGFATLSFISFDVILAKLVLSPSSFGQYSLLSITGKIIYFLGSLLSIFTISLVGRDLGKGLSPVKNFYKVFGLTFVLTMIGFICIGLYGNFFVPLLFGPKTQAILTYLPQYSAGIALFTISSSILAFHLAQEHYIFPIIAIITAILMSTWIALFSRSIFDITHVIFYTSLISFFAVVSLHVMEKVKVIRFKTSAI
ncbi:MAG: Polysaccharide transporter [uncultured bacterium]|nr:MAG: Polysaccharide transporter [uncultured bacterium]OGH13922.1 MAG: hypothetical protein A2687_03695 [Candidatus Levybacteria bacterium RIFCSPHIGHO2_01_FULL_38_26]